GQRLVGGGQTWTARSRRLCRAIAGIERARRWCFRYAGAVEGRFGKMKPLGPPDILYLKAALGWLELGNYVEANAELDKIAARLRAHPDALKVRWRVYAQAQKWNVCLLIAQTVTELEPEKPGGWIDYAQSLHRLN